MQDLLSFFLWYSVFLLIGLVFLPVTTFLFPNFIDKGYIFAKTIGIIFISYVAFLLSITKILTFNFSIIFAIIVSLLTGFLFLKKLHLKNIKESLPIFLFEEGLFLTGLAFWIFIRGNQPSIHGLEKFMDFGFVNSILRAEYLPPKDIWFTPFSINYYYFGHLVTAVLTKLSFITSNISFNLMIATLFSLSFVSSFSIGANLINSLIEKKKVGWLLGLIPAFFVTLGGNYHTVYTLFKPYQNENPIPFWELAFSPLTFANSYWYPNATRFIQNTIHEFPIYSWIVADLHGHVLDIPIVLLAIALIFCFFKKSNFRIFYPILIGFLLAVMYATNAWDGIIYFLFAGLIFLILALKKEKNKIIFSLTIFLKPAAATLISYLVFAFPFNVTFKPFVSGIGILCAPKALTTLEKLGPFLFEADHCQLSPLWQTAILYGFFYFLIASFLYVLNKIKEIKKEDIFIFALIVLSTILIILPEIIYIKDIYPAHYRANTMFKLVYQAFIMLSISSGYIIIRIFYLVKNFKIDFNIFAPWAVALLFSLFLILAYPFLAIPSYYNNLNSFKGLDGTQYLKEIYPDDYNAINWLNKNIKDQPVILEAQGDSYTDFARVSSNTGLPTVLGWTVHEWLWRGTYDIPAPRINEIGLLYESNDIATVKKLIEKYKISLVFVGTLEREKYKNLKEENFNRLGQIIYRSGQTKIYRINPI